MSAEQLILELHDCGVKLAVDGDDLLLDAPDGVLNASILDRLKQFKTEIIDRLASTPLLSDTIALPMPGLRESAYDAPLSFAQKRMIVLEAIAGDVSYYNIPLAYRIRGELRVDALRQAFHDLVAKHDVLRTIYVQDGEDYVQRICPPDDVPFEVVNSTAYAATDEVVASVLLAASNQRFDLSHEWPIRVTLTRFADHEFLLSVLVHHICGDGWSAKILVDDIQSAYARHLNAMSSDEQTKLHTGLQYTDYVTWHEAWMASANANRARDYWIDALAGAPSIHSFPTDFVRSAELSVAGDWYVETLPTTHQNAVEIFARDRKISSFTVFQTAFAALIHRYSAEDDFVFGTAVANRFPADFSRTIGLFVNTLPIRCLIGEAMDFNALTDEIIRVTRQGLVHQAYPFDAIVDAVQPDRGLSHNPLVQLMIVMQDDDAQSLSLPGLSTSQARTRQDVAKFDLTLHVHYSLRGISLHWEFNTGLFLPDTIKAISRSYIELLVACVTQSSSIVDELSLATGSVSLENRSQSNVEAPQCVHELVRSVALQRPEAIAVSEGTRHLTYAELERKAEALAESIVSRVGDCLRRPIAVYADRSPELVIAMYAIFKLGGIYVPLDPYHPHERVKFMMEDVRASVLLLERDTLVPPPETDCSAVCIEIDKACEQAASGQKLADDPTLPLYVIYTSGTTGRPKGVVVSNRALFYSLRANAAATEFEHTDTIPTIGSQAFGVSLLEILLPLITGGTVRIVRKAQVNDLEVLVASTNEVTVLHAVPSLMRQWLDFVSMNPDTRLYPNLRLLLVGGEPVAANLLDALQRWRPDVKILACYGMTECAIVCCSHDPKSSNHGNYRLGQPHPNVSFHVLNRRGQPQPSGVPGELHIGGLLLADGYVGQPELTRQRFVDGSAVGHEGLLYKTGDRVRRLANGSFEFLGRVDLQISLRGVRIEPGEIESLALRIDNVAQAVAHVVRLSNGDSLLALYFRVIQAGLDDDVDGKLRQQFSLHLPEYMRPSVIVEVEAFPLNPNGKIDRRNLPVPTPSENYVPPESDLEQRIAAIWGEALDLHQVSVTTNFFELGGHSLMAVTIANRVRKEFNVSFPLAMMFSVPTVRSCAGALAEIMETRLAANLMEIDASHADDQSAEIVI